MGKKEHDSQLYSVRVALIFHDEHMIELSLSLSALMHRQSRTRHVDGGEKHDEARLGPYLCIPSDGHMTPNPGGHASLPAAASCTVLYPRMHLG